VPASGDPDEPCDHVELELADFLVMERERWPDSSDRLLRLSKRHVGRELCAPDEHCLDVMDGRVDVGWRALLLRGDLVERWWRRPCQRERAQQRGHGSGLGVRRDELSERLLFGRYLPAGKQHRVRMQERRRCLRGGLRARLCLLRERLRLSVQHYDLSPGLLLGEYLRAGKLHHVRVHRERRRVRGLLCAWIHLLRRRVLLRADHLRRPREELRFDPGRLWRYPELRHVRGRHGVRRQRMRMSGRTDELFRYVREPEQRSLQLRLLRLSLRIPADGMFRRGMPLPDREGFLLWRRHLREFVPEAVPLKPRRIRR